MLTLRHFALLLPAAQAVERVGMPEAQIILSQAVTYMACAPKSNAAVNAIFSAMDSVKRPAQPYLSIFRTPITAAREAWQGESVISTHTIIPTTMWNSNISHLKFRENIFYEPGDMGYEKTIQEHLKHIKGES